MGSTKRTCNKERGFATNYFIFLKIYFGYNSHNVRFNAIGVRMLKLQKELFFDKKQSSRGLKRNFLRILRNTIHSMLFFKNCTPLWMFSLEFFASFQKNLSPGRMRVAAAALMRMRSRVTVQCNI